MYRIVFKYCVGLVVVAVQCGLRATGKGRKSEALTQLWQRKSAKALMLSQREDTAGGEWRHKLKRTTSPGNCESLKRPSSSRTRGTTAWQAEERIGPRNQ